MTLRLALILVAVAGVVGNAVLLAIGFAVRWRRTEPRWLRTWFPRSLIRYWRTLTARYLLWWASWPHLVERLLPRLRAPLMATPSVVVWRSGRATVSRFSVPGVRPSGDAVLIVHSVVTRPWILDLLPGRSLVGGLVEAGFDVHLLDWGDPGWYDARQGLTEHATVLGLASVAVAQHARGGRVHVVGYCMGATIALAAAGAWGTGPMASLTLVAPPYDTEVPGGTGELLRAPGLMPVLALDGQSLVPEAYIRESFHLLRRKVLKASVARLAKRKDREFQTVAGALSRWAWNQRKLPGRLWFDVVDLFRANAMLRGTLRIGGEPVRLDRITVPALVMVTDRDHIVPIASSLALTRAIPHAQVVRAPAGHVSMLMGHEARTVTIPAIAAFIQAASAPPSAPAPAKPAKPAKAAKPARPTRKPRPRKPAARRAAPRARR